MKEQMLIEASHGSGTSLELWERACKRLQDDIVITGSLENVFSFLEKAGHLTGSGEGDGRTFTITARGIKKARECQYAIFCADRKRITW